MNTEILKIIHEVRLYGKNTADFRRAMEDYLIKEYNFKRAEAELIYLEASKTAPAMEMIFYKCQQLAKFLIEIKKI